MTTFEVGKPHILVVDDTPANLQVLVSALQARGHQVRPVLDGRLALEVARRDPPALVLLDINMPEMSGFEVCAEFKKDPRLAEIPIIFLSANVSAEDKVHAFALGGVDYVTKPFHVEEVHARVEAHLKIRQLQRELDRHNHELEGTVRAQVFELSRSVLATITALAKLAECRDEDTGNHVVRVQHYCRALARRLAQDGLFGTVIDEAFIDNIFHASVLHDVGKVGISDAILLKPGRHTPAEFEIMKTHSAIGADTLAAVLDAHPHNAFVRMGVEVARSHHERWDGSGYPDGLAGDAIPLAARIVSLADQYDALRNKRPYKAPFDAATTHRILTEGDERSRPTHLDPRVLLAYTAIAPAFDAIYGDFLEAAAPAAPERAMIPDFARA
jgi:putative two-component system response regulator